eukprot:1181010-Prorocentrum_minimum.AAC.1
MVYSHVGPIRRRKRRYILTPDQSDLVVLQQLLEVPHGIFSRRTNQTQEAQQLLEVPHGIFSRRTNRTQEAQVYSHDGPISPDGQFPARAVARGWDTGSFEFALTTPCCVEYTNTNARSGYYTTPLVYTVY